MSRRWFSLADRPDCRVLQAMCQQWHDTCVSMSLSFVKQRLGIDLVVSLLVEVDKIVIFVVKICSDLLTKMVVDG